MAQLNFNAANVKPQESPAPIPAGVYLAQAVESDVRALKSGNGTALAVTFQVLQGPYAGRKVFANINVQHTSPEAERIGQSQLSALCHAVGVINLQDSVQLHMRPVMIRVKIRKDDTGQYGDRNEVNGFEAPTQGGTPGAAAAPAGFPAQPAQQQMPMAAAPAQAMPQHAHQAFPAQQAAPAAFQQTAAAPAAFAAPTQAAPAAGVAPWARRAA